jgi:hypothetical protein
MRKKRTRKKYTVRANMQVLELSKAGSSIDFEIFASKEKIGTIILGQGSLRWFGKNRKVGKIIPWTRFAEIMNRHCYNE